MPSQSVALVVVAAGRGTRLGAERPKQYLPCAGRPLFAHTLEALAAAWPFSAVDRRDPRRRPRALRRGARACFPPAARAGARAARDRRRDPPGERARRARGARRARARHRAHPRRRAPVSFPRSRRPRGRSGEAHGAAAPGTPLSDTVKQVDADGRVLATPPRAALRAVQTPQAFRFPLILEAHRRAAAEGVGDLTDDVAVAEWAGAPAYVFEGDPTNVKVTTMEDLHAAEARLIGRGERDARRPGFRRARLRARRPRLALRRPPPHTASLERPFGRRRRACTRSPTRSTARSPKATSARISRRPIRNGKARPRTSFWRMRRAASAPAAASSSISTRR